MRALVHLSVTTGTVEGGPAVEMSSQGWRGLGTDVTVRLFYWDLN